jgi:hypothetical protein
VLTFQHVFLLVLFHLLAIIILFFDFFGFFSFFMLTTQQVFCVDVSTRLFTFL